MYVRVVGFEILCDDCLVVVCVVDYYWCWFECFVIFGKEYGWLVL